MKRSEWQRAYDPDPVRLEARVRHTLANLDAAPAARPRALRTALIAAHRASHESRRLADAVRRGDEHAANQAQLAKGAATQVGAMVLR